MTDGPNPAAALRAALRDLLAMFTATLGEEAGAAALKTAVQRAYSDVTEAAPRRGGRPLEPASKPPAPKVVRAPKGRAKTDRRATASTCAVSTT